MRKTSDFISRLVITVYIITTNLSVNAQTPVTPPAAYSNPTINYIRIWEATAPEANPNTLMTRPLKDVKQTTQYFDGLGRPLQTVIKKGSLVTNPSDPANSSAATDMVAPVVYDEFGRERYKYLPFVANNTGGNTSINDGNFKLNPFQQQQSFYSTQLAGQNETFYYSKTNFEASPLNRVTEAYAPGNSWVGTESTATPHPVQIKYWINTATDDVKIWKVTDVLNSFGTYTIETSINGGVYAAGQLYKNGTIDEHGKQVIEFKDKEGKVILKKVQLTATPDDGTGRGYGDWLCTYYIYDDLGNLRCVIQPQAVKLMSDVNNWDVSPYLTEQCFRYEYDQRNRMIMKKVPGAGEVYMVYDPWDRLFLTQDANMRADHKFLFTKYDALNRPVMTGLYSYWGTIQEARQLAETYAPFRYEERSAANSGYTSRCWPEGNYELLTVTYYDDYNWYGNPFSQNRYTGDDGQFVSADPNNYPYPEAITQSFATKGMVTGSKRKILGTSDFLQEVIYYDIKGRVLQTYGLNQTGGPLVQTNQYSFSGQILRSYTLMGSNATNQAIGTLNIFNYDDLGRLADIKKTVYTSFGITKPEVTIVKNEYDKLGQLKKKKLAPYYNNSLGLETLEYDYNIRGWMLGMNRSFLETPNNTNNWFGFELGYDKTNSKGYYAYYNTGQYNGNITGTLWKSKGDLIARKYDFSYDAVNRLLTADFNQQSGTNWSKAEADFSLGGNPTTGGTMKYDANGNIKEMWQKGLLLTGSDWIDKLSYNYMSNSNKLLNVIDGQNNPQTKLGDFRTSLLHPVQAKNETTVDYTYDANGNLKKDLNKDMGNAGNDGIVYNHLNLPQVITVRKGDGTIKGTITYTYDAAGNKLKKVTDEYPSAANGNISTITTTNYIGGFVYERKIDTDPNTTDYTDKLQFGGHEEGRIRALYNTVGSPNTISGFAYDYMLKDHLGNVRMVLTDEQKSDPYPVASLETATLNAEKTVYNIPDAPSVRVNKSSVAGYPTDTYTSPNDFIHKLNGNGTKVGTSIVLKVMAGDKFNIRANSWYKLNGASPQTPINPLNDLLAALITGVANTGKAAITELSNSGVLTPGMQGFLTNQTYNSSKPKAYLNWVLFDEQLKFVSNGSGFEQVGAENVFTTHLLNNLPVTKNGFLYIYVSNETPNVDVFFDNLQVTQIRGPILEETHYYPFGLTMAGISSKALNNASVNRKKFNGIEHTTEFELNTYDAFFRNADPQIGRWWQIDPKPNMAESPYSMMGNNPILNSDPLGDTLVFNGSMRDVRKLERLINKSLDGYYTAKVDKKTRQLKLTTTGKSSEIKGQAKGLFNVLSKIVEDKRGTVNVKVVNGDKTIFGDNFPTGEIDVKDMVGFGDGKIVNSASMLGHALAEQSAKQLDGENYDDAHQSGLDAERQITGYDRKDSYLSNNVTGNPRTQKLRSGFVGLIYSSNGFNTFFRVYIHLKHGNVDRVVELPKEEEYK